MFSNFFLNLPYVKRSWSKRKQSIASVCFIFVFLGFCQKNPQQWYQSRLRLFEGDKEAEGRSLLLQQ